MFADDIGVAQQRPRVARRAMRPDDTRFTVNRAQFDNSEEAREKIRARIPGVRQFEHTVSTSIWSAPATGTSPRRGGWFRAGRTRSFTDDERETIRRGSAKVRVAVDWLEAAIDTGRFTPDEQLAQLLKGD